MDDIGEFLKVSPLNGYPPLKPREPLSVKSTNADPNVIHYVTLQPHSQIPVSANISQPFDSYFSSPVSPTDSPPVFTMSGGGFSQQMPQSTYTVLSPTSSPLALFPKVPQLNPAVSATSWSPVPTPASTPNRVEYSVPSFFDSIPQMPTLTDGPDEDGISISGDGDDGGASQTGSKTDKSHRKGRQRTDSGPLSAHAVYARMNRERKKKYIGDLERYRTTMKKKNVEGQRELDQIVKESQMLANEIASLRSILTSNKTLMSLLSMGQRAPNT